MPAALGVEVHFSVSHDLVADRLQRGGCDV
jgi:hypothetical protein